MISSYYFYYYEKTHFSPTYYADASRPRNRVINIARRVSWNMSVSLVGARLFFVPTEDLAFQPERLERVNSFFSFFPLLLVFKRVRVEHQAAIL